MKWIELKEGNPLPDYDEPALWIFEDGTMTVDSLEKDGNPWLFGGFIDEGGWRNDPSATHWMPLPPTPDASLPSSSVTGEEDWKFKFSEWLINNRGLPPIVVDIIVAHVERYIVKSIPVTGEWQLCPKCNGEGFLQIGKAIPDGRIDFTCEVCNGKKILAKPGESEGERKFSLKEALEIHKSGMLQGICSPEEANNKPDEIQRNYFKNKFGIDI